MKIRLFCPPTKCCFFLSVMILMNVTCSIRGQVITGLKNVGYSQILAFSFVINFLYFCMILNVDYKGQTSDGQVTFNTRFYIIGNSI